MNRPGASRAALVLSFLAWLTLLFRSLVDTRYILVEDFPQFGPGPDLVWFFGFTAIVGGWAWALVLAGQDLRAGWTACLIFSLVTALGFGLGSFLLFYSEPEEAFLFGASLVSGGLATFAIASRLWRHAA